jgi:hypothetical protein
MGVSEKIESLKAYVDIGGPENEEMHIMNYEWYSYIRDDVWYYFRGGEDGYWTENGFHHLPPNHSTLWGNRNYPVLRGNENMSISLYRPIIQERSYSWTYTPTVIKPYSEDNDIMLKGMMCLLAMLKIRHDPETVYHTLLRQHKILASDFYQP